ncbi:MAG: 50S ribosomal protein L6, partial [uncultured bacterium]
MSRLGKKAINIDPGIKVSVSHNTVEITGPKGQININLTGGIMAVVKDSQLEVKSNSPGIANLHGLYRSLIQNAIIGVKTGWSKTLELVGVGYRVETSGSELVLNLGFSHPIKIVAPKGISFAVDENKIIVSGVDKYMVGEVSASIRRIK